MGTESKSPWWNRTWSVTESKDGHELTMEDQPMITTLIENFWPSNRITQSRVGYWVTNKVLLWAWDKTVVIYKLPIPTEVALQLYPEFMDVWLEEDEIAALGEGNWKAKAEAFDEARSEYFNK